MAEIKSTLEMVMERADRLCQESSSSPGNDDISRKGMKCAAAFLKDENTDILQDLNNCAKEESGFFKKGMIEAFLRNLVLPREAEDISEAAMNGLLLIEQAQGGPASLPGLLSECRSILLRYIEHKAQLRQQLEEAFVQQTAQLEQNLAQQTGVAMKVDPSQHPKFAEEWQNVTASLDEQYGNALTQYKNAINERLLSP